MNLNNDKTLTAKGQASSVTEQVLNDASAVASNPDASKPDSNVALLLVLDLSHKMAQLVPGEVGRIEARALVAILPSVIEALAVLNRDCKAALITGIR